MPPLVWWGDKPGGRMTDADRLLFLALRAYEADLCTCGQPRSEAWSIENDRRNPNHTHYYDTGPPFYCSSCDVLDKRQRAFADSNGSTAGRYWAAQLVPRGLALA